MNFESKSKYKCTSIFSLRLMHLRVSQMVLYTWLYILNKFVKNIKDGYFCISGIHPWTELKFIFQWLTNKFYKLYYYLSLKWEDPEKTHVSSGVTTIPSVLSRSNQWVAEQCLHCQLRFFDTLFVYILTYRSFEVSKGWLRVQELVTFLRYLIIVLRYGSSWVGVQQINVLFPHWEKKGIFACVINFYVSRIG